MQAIRLTPYANRLIVAMIKPYSETESGIVIADHGTYRIDPERATRRLNNIWEDRELDPRKLAAAEIDILDGYTESRPMFNPYDLDVAIVVGGCQNPRYGEPNFGDVIGVPKLRTINWNGFWKATGTITTDKTVHLANEDNTRVMAIRRDASIGFIELTDAPYAIARYEDVSRECTALTTSPPRQVEC